MTAAASGLEFKLGMVEDDQTWPDLYGPMLPSVGVELIEIASTMDEARALAHKILRKEVELDGLLLDANISPEKTGPDADGEDAREIVELLALDSDSDVPIFAVPIIGFSQFGFDTYDPPIPCSADFTKAFNIEDLASYLTSLRTDPTS